MPAYKKQDYLASTVSSRDVLTNMQFKHTVQVSSSCHVILATISVEFFFMYFLDEKIKSVWNEN